MIDAPPIFAWPMDGPPTGPPPEPCVNCEKEAAKGWLLCLSCAATTDHQLVLDLAAKFKHYEIWLEDAEKVLRDLPASAKDTYQAALPIWMRRFHVHMRLGWMLWRVEQG